MELLGVKSSLAIAEKGDFGVAETGFEALKSIPMTNEQKLRTADARADVFLLERRYSDGLREAESLSDDQVRELSHGPMEQILSHWLCAQSTRGRARSASGLPQAKSAAEEQLKRTPDVAKLRIQLAKVLAFLGRKGFRDGGSATCERIAARKSETRLKARQLRKVWHKSAPFLAPRIGRSKFWMDC